VKGVNHAMNMCRLLLGILFSSVNGMQSRNRHCKFILSC